MAERYHQQQRPTQPTTKKGRVQKLKESKVMKTDLSTDIQQFMCTVVLMLDRAAGNCNNTEVNCCFFECCLQLCSSNNCNQPAKPLQALYLVRDKFCYFIFSFEEDSEFGLSAMGGAKVQQCKGKGCTGFITQDKMTRSLQRGQGTVIVLSGFSFFITVGIQNCN